MFGAFFVGLFLFFSVDAFLLSLFFFFFFFSSKSLARDCKSKEGSARSIALCMLERMAGERGKRERNNAGVRESQTEHRYLRWYIRQSKARRHAGATNQYCTYTLGALHLTREEEHRGTTEESLVT